MKSENIEQAIRINKKYEVLIDYRKKINLGEKPEIRINGLTIYPDYDNYHKLFNVYVELIEEFIQLVINEGKEIGLEFL